MEGKEKEEEAACEIGGATRGESVGVEVESFESNISVDRVEVEPP